MVNISHTTIYLYPIWCIIYEQCKRVVYYQWVDVIKKEMVYYDSFTPPISVTFGMFIRCNIDK